jgi:glycosyltransferase involved in cell wall biosynthesis
LNSIPSIASRIGGIPEALGEGGVLLPSTDPPDIWAAMLEKILSDSNLYNRLSANASLSAARPELNPDEIARSFLKIAHNHVQSLR